MFIYFIIWKEKKCSTICLDGSLSDALDLFGFEA